MELDEKISILVFGAGAIGSYIGGSLANQGHQVVFLERSEAANLLLKKGMSIKTIQNTSIEIFNPLVFSDLNLVLEKYKFDVAIIAVKSYDTDDLIKSWSANSDKLPPVLCFQNGVENEEKYKAVLGNSRVISGTVTTAVGKPDLGEIVVEKLRGIGIASDHPLSQKIVTFMDEAGLKARLYDNPASMKWSKMLTNLLANASSAILQITPEKIFSSHALYSLEVDQIRETIAVMKLHHIPIIDLPGTPVKALIFVINYFPKKISRLILKNALIKGRGEKMPSFYLDMVGGRGKSEVDMLNGAVVRYGEVKGFQAKVNKKLTEILDGIVSRKIDQNVYKNRPEKLIEEIYSIQKENR